VTESSPEAAVEATMSASALAAPTEPLVLHLTPTLRQMSDHEFFELCQRNPYWSIEQTAEGDLVISSPVGGETGRRSFELTGIFGAWVEVDGSGLGFDSSTGFKLLNGAKRSPDLAWVRRARWAALSAEAQEGFPPLCPDFVVELRSRSDLLATLQDKLQEYIANGAELGWLIDPIERKVYVYRLDTDVVCLEDPQQLSGDPLLPGFVLDLSKIW
jgi:Uma2 family endonuclease